MPCASSAQSSTVLRPPCTTRRTKASTARWLRKPTPVMTPLACRIGTNTAQHNVPETSMVAQTRMPVMAPAARKMKSQEKMTVRPDQASYWLPRSHFCRPVRMAPLEKRSRLALIGRQPLGPELVDRGNEAGNAQCLGRAHALRAFGMQGAQGFGRRDAGREAQLLDIDHLPLHGDGHGDAEHGDEEHPGQHQRHGHRLVVDDDVGGKGRDQRAAGRVAGRTRRRLHAVVLEDGHRRASRGRP